MSLESKVDDERYAIFERLFANYLEAAQHVSDIVHTAIMSYTAGRQVPVLGVYIGLGMMLRVMVEQHSGWDGERFLNLAKDVNRYFTEHAVRPEKTETGKVDMSQTFPQQGTETKN